MSMPTKNGWYWYRYVREDIPPSRWKMVHIPSLWAETLDECDNVEWGPRIADPSEEPDRYGTIHNSTPDLSEPSAKEEHALWALWMHARGEGNFRDDHLQQYREVVRAMLAPETP